jgi:hypothetical protein
MIIQPPVNVCEESADENPGEEGTLNKNNPLNMQLQSLAEVRWPFHQM